MDINLDEKDLETMYQVYKEGYKYIEGVPRPLSSPGGGGATSDHAALSNLEFAASGHIGFSPAHNHPYEPADANIQAHIVNLLNPHQVTKAQVGLGNVYDIDIRDWFTLEGVPGSLYLKAKFPFASVGEIQAFTDDGTFPPTIWESMPAATETTMGGFKIGANLTMVNGVLSASAAGEVAGAVAAHEQAYDHTKIAIAFGWGDHANLYEPINSNIQAHISSAHQTIINGTGFVKATGTALSFDNTTYLASSQYTVDDVKNKLSDWFVVVPNSGNPYLRCLYPFASDGEIQAYTDNGQFPPETIAGVLKTGEIGKFLQADGQWMVVTGGVSSWTDLTGKPTNVSYWTNDSGYITSAALSPYAPLANPVFTGSVTNSGFTYYIGSGGSAGTLSCDGNLDTILAAASGKSIHLHGGTGSDDLTVDPTGKVGIGTSTPGSMGFDVGSYKLGIDPGNNNVCPIGILSDSSGRVIRFTDQSKTSTGALSITGSALTFGSNTYTPVNFIIGAATRMSLLSSGLYLYEVGQSTGNGSYALYYNTSSGQVTWEAGNAHTHYTLGTTYISGGTELPNHFGGAVFKPQMLYHDWGWVDTLWISTYGGGDVPLSNQLLFSKSVSGKVGFRQQNFDSGSWGTTYELWHTGNFTLANPTFNDITNLGWFKSEYYNLGLYNIAEGMHLYADSSGRWVMGGASYYPRLMFRDTFEGTVRGLIYSDGAGFGILNNTQSWSVRCNYGGNNAGGTLYGAWDAIGTLTATNFISTSDIRKKINITSIDTTTDDVEYFRFEMKDNPGRYRFGSIAQYLLKNHPEFVYEDSEGSLSVAYADLHSLEISNLKTEVRNLKTKIVDMERRLAS